MADIHKLSLPESSLNLSVDEIIEWLRGLVDLNGTPLFESVERGLALVDEEGTPDEVTVPCVRVWHVNREFPLDNEQGDLTNNVGRIALYIYFFSFEGIDLQRQRENLVDYILRRMNEPQSGVTDETGIQPVNFNWLSGSTCFVDHESPFKNVSESYKLAHPWYATRIDLPLIQTYNHDN